MIHAVLISLDPSSDHHLHHHASCSSLSSLGSGVGVVTKNAQRKATLSAPISARQCETLFKNQMALPMMHRILSSLTSYW